MNMPTVSTDFTLAKAHLWNAKCVALDTETTGIEHLDNKLVGVSAYVPGDDVGFYLPVYSRIDPDSALVPMCDVLNLISRILCDPCRRVIFHNATFDLRMFRKHGIVSCCQIVDTMYMAHRLDTDLRAVHEDEGDLNYRLKTLTRHHFGFKQQTFEETTGGYPAQMVPIQRMAGYAVADAYLTARLYELFSMKLEAEPGVRQILEEIDFPVIPMIVEMLHHGIPVDPVAIERHEREARDRFQQIEGEIRNLLGRLPALSKEDVLRSVLVNDCGIPAEELRSLSENNFRRIMGQVVGPKASLARTFLGLIIARREQAQLISKFLVPLANRVRGSVLFPGGFHMMLATGRFASQKPNVQALPQAKESPVRRVIVAEPNHTIVSIDFSYIEPRCLAQAILGFMKEGRMPIEGAETANRGRAKSRFGELLKSRQFTKSYQEPAQLSYPEESALANGFLTGDIDPYIFVAKRLFGVEVGRKDPLRKKVKTIFLGIIYGESLAGLVAKMRQDEPTFTRADGAKLLNKFAAEFPEIGCQTYEVTASGIRTAKPTLMTYKTHVEALIRLTGEVSSLFGRKRRFAGLRSLREHDRVKIIYQTSSRDWTYEYDVAPVQPWNWALHAYVHNVRNYDTGLLIGTSTWRGPYPQVHKTGICHWPFRQLSYKYIRSVEADGKTIDFLPLEDCFRQGFNAQIQMTASDVFKKAMLRVRPVMAKYDARMILNVHDEIVFHVPTCKLHRFVQVASKAMEARPAPWWKIPIKVSVEVGPTYGEMADYIRPGFWERVGGRLKRAGLALWGWLSRNKADSASYIVKVRA